MMHLVHRSHKSSFHPFQSLSLARLDGFAMKSTTVGRMASFETKDHDRRRPGPMGTDDMQDAGPNQQKSSLGLLDDVRPDKERYYCETATESAKIAASSQ